MNNNLKNSNNLSIIYHSKDMDGLCSGSLLKHYFPNAELIGYDHGQPINFKMKNNVIFADICFKIDEMYELSKSHNITWIDHHVSSYNNYQNDIINKGEYLTVIYDVNFAACYNVYKWLYPNNEVPYGVKLLSDFDIWNKKSIFDWDNKILPFQFGLRSICNSIDTFPYDCTHNITNIYNIISDGKKIVKYQDNINKHLCKRYSFEFKFQGYNVIALNIAGGSLLTFKSVYDTNKHDMVMTYYYNGISWHISFYTSSDIIDCSCIANNNGGGGHRQAAGFEIDDINKVLNDNLIPQ